jgi:hypothetical protein
MGDERKMPDVDPPGRVAERAEEELRGTAWDLPVLEPHAELVTASDGVRFWVVAQPAGTMSVPATDQDPVAPDLADVSLTVQVLGWVLNRVVFRGRWTVRVLPAGDDGRPARRALHRERVPADTACLRALRLQRALETQGGRPSRRDRVIR